MARLPWSALGLTPSATSGEVRRAYATRLRAIDPDSDPKAFEKLRQARDHALAQIRARDRDQPGQTPMGQARPLGGGDGHDVDLLTDQIGLARPTLGARTGDAATISTTPVHDSSGPFAFAPSDIALRYDSGDSGASDLALPSVDTTPPINADIGKSHGHILTSTAGSNRHQDITACQNALYATLLNVAPDEPLIEDDRVHISQNLEQLLASPEMHEIGFAADMENWLAEIFAQSTPRSHPFVQRLADHFNWRSEAGTLNQRPAVRWLTDRALAFDFRDRVSQPGNKGYRAWIELTTPADEYSKRGRTKMVPELLAAIRKDHPVLEQELDWFRVSLWDRANPASQPSTSNWHWSRVAIFLFIGLQILAALGRCSADQTRVSDRERERAVAQAAFDDPVQRSAAMDEALRAVGGDLMTLDITSTRKAPLADYLESILTEASHGDSDLESTVPTLQTAVLDYVRGGIVVADDDLLATYRRSQSAVLKQLAVIAPDDCTPLMRQQPVVLSRLPEVLSGNLRRAQAQLALLPRGELRLEDDPGRFSIPTTIVDDAGNRVNRTRSQVIEDFGGDHGDERMCLAIAAMIDATLAAPSGADTRTVLREF